MDLRNLPGQVQAQAASLRRHVVRRADLVELLEDVPDLRLLDADPVVLEPQLQLLAPGDESDVHGGGARLVVLHGVGQDVHQEHVEQRGNDGAPESHSRRVVDPDLRVAEQVRIALPEPLDRVDQVRLDELLPVAAALDPGQVHDAVDIVQEPVHVVDHEPDVPEPVLPREVVLREGLQVELQGGDGRLELVSEAVDEISLHPVELLRLLVVDEDDEDPRQDDRHQDAEHQDDDPRLDLEELGGVELVALDNGGKPRADLDVPVDVEGQRGRQGDDGKDEDEDGMIEPPEAIHGHSPCGAAGPVPRLEPYNGGRPVSMRKVFPGGRGFVKLL